MMNPRNTFPYTARTVRAAERAGNLYQPQPSEPDTASMLTPCEQATVTCANDMGYADALTEGPMTEDEKHLQISYILNFTDREVQRLAVGGTLRNRPRMDVESEPIGNVVGNTLVYVAFVVVVLAFAFAASWPFVQPWIAR